MPVRVLFLFLIISPALLAKTSSELRSEKQYSILVGTGVHLQIGPESGFKFAYNKDSTTQPQVYYYGKSVDLGDNESVYLVESDVRLSGKVFGISLSYFILDSFFLNGGLQYKELDLDINLKTRTSVALKSEATGKIRTFGLSGAIGNQWVFDNGIVLNLQYLGNFAPLSSAISFAHRSTLEDQETGSLNDAYDEVKNNWKGASAGTAPCVQLDIGFMF